MVDVEVVEETDDGDNVITFTVTYYEYPAERDVGVGRRVEIYDVIFFDATKRVPDPLWPWREKAAQKFLDSMSG
jgi:hypothetical protein